MKPAKKPIAFSDGSRWRPHLMEKKAGKDKPGALLHVVVTDSLQPYFVQRLRAAQADGWALHLVADVGSLYTPDFVKKLVGLDLTIHVTKDDGNVDGGRDLLALLGEYAAPLPRDAAIALAEGAWARRRGGPQEAPGLPTY